jgi:hypothetical protein
MLKKMKKRVKNLQSLRGCQYPCKVIVDHVGLLARLSTSDDALNTEVYSNISYPVKSCVSLLANGPSSPDREFTIGGLVRVGSEIYGLTVAHAFQRDYVTELNTADASYDGTSDSDSDNGTDTDESLFHELNSDRMSVFTTRSRISGDLSRTPTNESNMTLSEATLHDDLASDMNLKMSYIGQLHHTTDPSKSLDWALVRMTTDTSHASNTYWDPRRGVHRNLQNLVDVTGALGRQVRVLAGKSGAQSGTLGQSNVQTVLKGQKYCVSKVILTRNLGELVQISP